jgi:preprotein translocase subunit SecE
VKGTDTVARKVIDEPSEEIVENAKKERAGRNPFARIVLFIKQVFGELKKVVTPTRRELLSYTIVVLIFVVIMMAIVVGLDTLFGWLAVVTFGE